MSKFNAYFVTVCLTNLENSNLKYILTLTIATEKNQVIRKGGICVYRQEEIFSDRITGRIIGEEIKKKKNVIPKLQ